MPTSPSPRAETMRVPPKQVSPVGVSILIEHVTRACHSVAFSEGLNPAQWNALRYLSRANPSACTVTAFAQHNLTKKSTASETMAALIKKEFVTKRDDPDDARSKLLELTAKGQALLEKDPFLTIAEVLKTLSGEDIDKVSMAMEILLRALFKEKPGRSAAGIAGGTP